MEEKNKGGRPSKKDTLDFDLIEKYAGLGLIDDEIAQLIGISTVTLNAWKKDPKFLNALKAGKLKSDAEVIESLHKRALGFSRFVKKATYDKKTHKIEEWEEEMYFPPDSTSCIFWLKNRRPHDWRDKQIMEHLFPDFLHPELKDINKEQLLKELDALRDKQSGP